MINRVTNQTLMASAQRNLQTTMAKTAELQDKASSLKKLARPSDDPTATGDALRIRNELRATEQYGRNIDNGLGWASTADTTLGSTTELLRRVRDLTVQGGNGSLSAVAREAIAVEVDGLKNDLLAQANTTYLGRNIFAGNSDAGSAFNADFSWNGSTGSTVQRRIGPDETIRVDVDGAKTFGEGSSSVFALLENISADLRTGTNVSSRLNGIDERMNAMVSQRAELGARHASLERADQMNLAAEHSLEASRAGVEDVDLAEIILDLKLHEVNYQAALAVTAKVLQPTLMDFLR